MKMIPCLLLFLLLLVSPPLTSLPVVRVVDAVSSSITSSSSSSLSSSSSSSSILTAILTTRGGGGRGGAFRSSSTKVTTGNTNNTSNEGYNKKQQNKVNTVRVVPSIYWAVLHNWLYFLSLGFNAINMPYLIREIVDGKQNSNVKLNTNYKPSSKAISLSGNVEAIDKICTFMGIGFLSALSDKYGRKPLLVWSSLGFAVTNLVQAFVGSSYLSSSSSSLAIKTGLLYLADFIDGCSSCMTPVCQAYIADICFATTTTTPTASRKPGSSTDDSNSASNSNRLLATKLGIFQGISIGGAFMIAFPVGGILGAKYGPRLPILIAAGFQLLNGVIALYVTPESNTLLEKNRKKRITFAEVNPITGLQKLFGIGSSGGSGGSSGGSHTHSLRIASLTYFCSNLARSSLDAQFVNYSNIRFGWTQAQSGPVLVMVGLMLAIVPRIIVPLLGLTKSINYGLFIYMIGLGCAGISESSSTFILSIFVISIGTACLPALTALLAGLSPPGEAGALIGAVGSLNELTGAIGSSMYATILALFATSASSSTSASASSMNNSNNNNNLLLKYLPHIPGMHFLVGGLFCSIGWFISMYGLNKNKNHPALLTSSTTMEQE